MNGLIEHLSFWWPTLLPAAALAIAGGIAGVFVILRKQTLLVLSLPQIVTLGAAVGLRLGWPTLPPAVGCLVLAMSLIAISSRRGTSHLLLPALYVAGVCLSILVVAGAAAELQQVQHYFVGIDVAVGETEAKLVAVVLAGAACVIALLWRRWLLLAQAPTAAELARLRPSRWDALFLALICLILVLSTDTLGAAMGIVMLFLPAATVLPWGNRVPTVMLLASLAGIIFLIGGDILSNTMDWPLSQSVGGVGCAAVLCSHLLARR